MAYNVVRYDIAKNGYATGRKPVPFDDLEAACRYVALVYSAIEKWGDDSIVGLYDGEPRNGRTIPVSRTGEVLRRDRHNRCVPA